MAPHRQTHTKKHTRYLGSICSAHIQNNPRAYKQMIWLHSPEDRYVHACALWLTSFLPPSLVGSTCVLSYLLQTIIVPTYGVSSFKPQFRGSEILLSDCHNASASLPPTPISLLQSPGCLLASPLTILHFKCFFLTEMLHWHFHFVALCHSVCFFLFFLCSHPPVTRQVLPLCLSLKSPPPVWLERRALVTTSRCHYALPVTHLFA